MEKNFLNGDKCGFHVKLSYKPLILFMTLLTFVAHLCNTPKHPVPLRDNNFANSAYIFMMKALRKFLFKPLEYALLLGILLVFAVTLFAPVTVAEAWKISLSPAFLWLSMFGLFFGLIFFLTYISTSSTEM